MPEPQRTSSGSSVWSFARAYTVGDADGQLNTYDEACGRWAQDHGRLALVVCSDDGSTRTWTYPELDRDVRRACTVLQEVLGLHPGAHVASILPQGVEAWIVALAVWRSGMVLIPLYDGFGREAIASRLSDARPEAVFVGPGETAGKLRAVLPDLSTDSMPAVVTVGEDTHDDDPHVLEFWSSLDAADTGSQAVPTLGSDPATIIYTSGTSGDPKGCVIPHKGYLAVMPFITEVLELSPTDLLFATSDPAWSYGLYTTGLGPMAIGCARLVYTGRFDAGTWLDLIAEHEVSAITTVPTALRRLVDRLDDPSEMASLRTVCTAGEPLGAELERAWLSATGTAVIDGYGLTEIGMVLASSPAADMHREGWLDGPVPGFEIELIDAHSDNGRTQGALAIRRPDFTITDTYLGRDHLWDSKWREDYFVTEDLFERDAGGRLRCIGRVDDVIITAGYNVGPAEVEEAAVQHPGVTEAAAVARPDDERGSVVFLFLVASNPVQRSDETFHEVCELVRSDVGRHAVPRDYKYVDSLPRTVTGKLQRGSLRDTLI